MQNPLYINTPLIRSQTMSSDETSVWLKMEALQPAGSFKNRGISHACQIYAEQGAQQFISSSGGNAGIATAYSGFKLNIPVTVVVPDNATKEAISAIEQFEAQVIHHGSTWIEAHQHAMNLCTESSQLIHPFDDPLLWPGHATMIDEVVNDGLNPDAVILSVGGGGLLTGVAMGLERNGLKECKIVAVETYGAASLNAAMDAKQPVMLESINTVANTLGAKQVSQAAFETTQLFDTESILVSDKQAVSACYRFVEDHRVLVEPACGATLSVAYAFSNYLADQKNILVVVCGGMGVNLSQLDRWSDSFN